MRPFPGPPSLRQILDMPHPPKPEPHPLADLGHRPRTSYTVPVGRLARWLDRRPREMGQMVEDELVAPASVAPDYDIRAPRAPY